LTVLPPFAVVAVPFPFVDRARSSIMRGTRRRPALVPSTETFNRSPPAVLLAMITTARSSHWASDVVMEDWQAAGLTVPCRVRFKLLTLGASLVAGRAYGVRNRSKEKGQDSLGPPAAWKDSSFLDSSRNQGLRPPRQG
jgi:mRNA interferase MazF